MLASPHRESHAPIFGDPLVELRLESAFDPGRLTPGAIVVGVDRQGALPAVAAQDFDILLTTATGAPAPWAVLPPAAIDAEVERLRRRTQARPLSCSTLVQVLRAGARLPFADALTVESLAYSMLLAGSEFHAWRSGRGTPRPVPPGGSRVRFERRDDAIRLHLANPGRRNAFDARMRDELVECLRAVADDPTATSLAILGDGPAFCSGGDLDEFGVAVDVAAAHAIRTLRSPALVIQLLRERTTVYLQGACVGAGTEFAVAAGRVVAAPGSWFRLPEVDMGLIPGCGGTVTVPRRIGRHRTAYWVLADLRLDTTQALDWGLVDEIGSPP